jgi:hypothetical protein
MSSDATFEKLDPKTGELLAEYKNFTSSEVFMLHKLLLADGKSLVLPHVSAPYLSGLPI